MSSIADLVRLAPALAVVAVSASAADEPPFRDDRSDPAAIVASLYDALNRHEYARAWSYFGDDKPVSDYATFVDGYADTDRLMLRLGEVVTDGAAGSSYGSVPVALAATGTDGRTRVFAGCYTTRQVQPAIQEPPFRPLEIVAGKLAPTDAALDDAVPAECPEP
jgi:hypothetical protein